MPSRKKSTCALPAHLLRRSRRLSNLAPLFDGHGIDKIKPRTSKYRYALTAADLAAVPDLYRAATRNKPAHWGAACFRRLLKRQPWPKGTVKVTIQVFPGAEWVVPGDILRIGDPEAFEKDDDDDESDEDEVVEAQDADAESGSDGDSDALPYWYQSFEEARREEIGEEADGDSDSDEPDAEEPVAGGNAVV
ncbi:hypothetical protein FN846DRAFT_892871 [Sphaerosporella brunnea]|uniref:Uncharacterized protein n=1 Tax=Sphaerosporella brunnea TaxID=1250544 RepID=A0A5J5ENV0_9PEZI|nr:hypothetical protein FN846DRAFT_892871 [Sphaerosporella brunnea]